ncbi:MAG: Mpo1-like protein [Saprospiraceae bacterium]|nr:Mpo1-like protein [Saprospiraceae bacterium]
MSKSIQQWLDAYGESHQNPTNKLVHWVCVPSILFSIIGLLYAIPFPVEKTMFLNWAAVAFALALVFYLRLSFSMFLGFVVIAVLMLWAWHSLAAVGIGALWALGIFVVAWIGQFWGHQVEGKKPSFLQDVQFLLIGPAWLLHFVYRRMGIPF